MYETLRMIHSVLRYLILMGGIGAIIVLAGNARARAKAMSTTFLMFTHLQALTGLILYFFATPWFGMLRDNAGEVMKNKVYRFFAVEHPLMMLIAVVLITIGNSKVKKALKNETKFTPALVLFVIALLVIFAAIPWPFRDLERGWL